MYEKGLNQGIQQGMIKGKKEGIEKGIQKTNIANAKKMLELDIDLETISKITGLTKEKINDLK